MATNEPKTILYELGLATAKLMATTKKEIDLSVDEKIEAHAQKAAKEAERTNRRVKQLWFAHINNQGGR